VRHCIDMGAGVIDQDYTGELKVLWVNHLSQPFQVALGDQITQLIVEKYQVTQPQQVNNLRAQTMVNRVLDPLVWQVN
jgi:dUTP pyrophosphatase